MRLSGEGEAVTVFPNPSGDWTAVQLLDIDKAVSYQLIDALGRTIAFGNFDESSNNLDLRAFPSGVYHLALEVEGRQLLRRIVKQ